MDGYEGSEAETVDEEWGEIASCDEAMIFRSVSMTFHHGVEAFSGGQRLPKPVPSPTASVKPLLLRSAPSVSQKRPIWFVVLSVPATPMLMLLPNLPEDRKIRLPPHCAHASVVKPAITTRTAITMRILSAFIIYYLPGLVM